MVEGRSNTTIDSRPFITKKAVSMRINSILSDLGVRPSNDDNRRVMAVLTYLNT
jgi:hypothetical protein